MTNTEKLVDNLLMRMAKNPSTCALVWALRTGAKEPVCDGCKPYHPVNICDVCDKANLDWLKEHVKID